MTLIAGPDWHARVHCCSAATIIRNMPKNMPFRHETPASGRAG